ncbi:MAG: methylmalonyl-CoA mutase [Dehalococcoidia bacterium]|nr:methylmalonyl-CoA mutase [Dehalococcoidia bacterium]
MTEKHGLNQETLRTAQDKWQKEVLDPSVKRFKEREGIVGTSSVETKTLYTPLDAEGDGYLEKQGFPGQYPFTRGVQATMFRGRLWTMRQYAGFGAAEETNQRFQYLLKEGQTGLSMAFDLPTQLGYDSDNPMAMGEVGKVGVAISSLQDMETCFAGIPLDKVSTSMTINAPASVLLAMYVVAAEKQGVSADKLSGTSQNDVLKEYVARGTYIYPPGPSLRIAADLIAYCAERVPQWNPISVSGYHMRDAGCTAAEEIAFSFANAIAYIDVVLALGLKIDDFAPRISWIFNTHNNFLEEVAKYRALRRVWAKLLKERFGAQRPQSMMLRTHTQTGGSTLTAQQPENNIARAAIQALAAVLGGVQSMALSCYDEALAIPTEKAQRIALRTQQVIAYETGAAETVDPLAGSYYVEALTDELEHQAWALMRQIEDMGGAVAAVQSGFYQRRIQESAVRYQREIESGKRVIVGVNQFTEGDEGSALRFQVDPGVAKLQAQKLAKLRATRDNAAVAAALGRLKAAAEDPKAPLMREILTSVKAYATTGEICDTLREVYGEYQPPTVI